jgi:hypothetical protein
MQQMAPVATEEDYPRTWSKLQLLLSTMGLL